jgi:hypothetical protein
MKQKLNTDLQRRLHNPNLLPRKIAGKTGDTPEHAEFYEKYLAAAKQTSYRYLAYGLESSYVDEDQGFGGFYDSGFISPSFIGGRYATINDSNWEKDFKFYWPKDIRTGKYMRYLGSINLGVWPQVFSDYTQIKPEAYYCNVSFAGGKDLWRGESRRENTNVWLSVFVGEGYGDFEMMVPDCHIRMNCMDDFDRMSDWEKNYRLERKSERNAWSDDQIIAKMKEWQETMCVKSRVKGAPKFFSKPKMRFHYDGPCYDRERQYDTSILL